MSSLSSAADTAYTQLNELLKSTAYVRVDGNSLILVHYHNSGDTETVVTKDVLDIVHPRLAEALHNVAMYWKTAHQIDTLGTGAVAMQARYLRKEFVEVTAEFGGAIAVTGVLSAQLCTESEVEPERLVIDVTHFGTQTTLPQRSRTSERVTAPYVVTESKLTTWVDMDWLDTQYPDWRARLPVAQGLDLDPEAFMRYLFGQTPALSAPANLDNIQLT